MLFVQFPSVLLFDFGTQFTYRILDLRFLEAVSHTPVILVALTRSL